MKVVKLMFYYLTCASVYSTSINCLLYACQKERNNLSLFSTLEVFIFYQNQITIRVLAQSVPVSTPIGLWVK